MRVLIVEDLPPDREILREILKGMGHEVVEAGTIAEAARLLSGAAAPVVVSDMHLPDGRATALVEEFGERIPLILLTAFGQVDDAVDAMRRGAFDYLTKPVKAAEIEVALQRAKSWSETRQELARLREMHESDVAERGMISRSPRMRSILETVRAAADSNASILIQGESGTGKEVLFRLIHGLSTRADGPAIAVNCGAIPENLLEAELFGHEKGAFTGATARRVGRIERADRGTLFLDEIGTLPLNLQTRLLRVLQEREIERVGGTGPVKVDFRLVSATNADLQQEVAAGRFREDLFYRLNVIRVQLPPLRDRREDLPALVAHFLAKFGAPQVTVQAEALEALRAYAWPGNIRQLENTIERALVLRRDDVIGLRHLPEELLEAVGIVRERPPEHADAAPDRFETLEEIKKRHVAAALEKVKGRREEAAKLLDIHRNTLRQLIEKYELAVPGRGED